METHKRKTSEKRPPIDKLWRTGTITDEVGGCLIIAVKNGGIHDYRRMDKRLRIDGTQVTRLVEDKCDCSSCGGDTKKR